MRPEPSVLKIGSWKGGLIRWLVCSDKPMSRKGNEIFEIWLQRRGGYGSTGLENYMSRYPKSFTQSPRVMLRPQMVGA
jgi:hypothetical protein